MKQPAMCPKCCGDDWDIYDSYWMFRCMNCGNEVCLPDWIKLMAKAARRLGMYWVEERNDEREERVLQG